MIKKYQQFLIFLTFCSNVTGSEPYSPQTPHPSDHSDETQSSLIQSQSTVLQSRSNSSRSLTPSPEPQNPVDHLASEKKSQLDFVSGKIQKHEQYNNNVITQISNALNMRPEELQEKAFHEFYNPNKAPEESDHAKVHRMLYQLGLKRPIKIEILDDTINSRTSTDSDNENSSQIMCSFNPYMVQVNRCFLKLSNLEQESRLVTLVERLNQCEFGIRRVIDQNPLTNESLEVSQLKEKLANNTNIIALLRLLKKTIKDNNPKGTLHISQILQEYEEEVSAISFTLREPLQAPQGNLTKSPRKPLTGKRERNSSVE